MSKIRYVMYMMIIGFSGLLVIPWYLKEKYIKRWTPSIGAYTVRWELASWYLGGGLVSGHPRKKDYMACCKRGFF